ncbi:NUDIX domain-containing protein [Asanoa sp. NPDC049518]|uniref:NUDIX domain-containing protein n=1 Tax=unclassified Asanoa TaxID=2685164 RepID=UPI00341289E9
MPRASRLSGQAHHPHSRRTTVPKTDYLDDPSAPRANSLVVAVTAAVRDDLNRILLLRRSDNGLWALPGGAQEIGESTAEAAVREVQEETGLTVEIQGISGIYSNPNHVIAYDNGEVRQEFSICFHAVPVGGSLTTSPESTEFAWVSLDSLDALPMQDSMRLRAVHGIQRRTEPYIG